MTTEDFVKMIRTVVLEAAVASTLSVVRDPPGRRPEPSLVEAANWFHKLSEEERMILEGIIRRAAHQSVFGFLAVLDGARAVEDSPEKGQFQLMFRKDGMEWQISPTEGVDLHDLLNETSENRDIK